MGVLLEARERRVQSIKFYWKGPAIVSHVEYKADEEKIMEANVWCVHGSALIRSLHELVRPGMPQERMTR